MHELYSARRLWKIISATIPRAGMLAAGVLIVGCGTTMEDGYKPHPLGATPEARKAYYASPFTDEAAANSHEAAPAIHPGSR
ncbi:MAG TPA: hypothetical protein VFE47_23560 [Tepidisphaeraceae bacterium]|jgi:hypothetical protein|nr:hypothetical protein [Tepidisphaeraceae bacterium]